MQKSRRSSSLSDAKKGGGDQTFHANNPIFKPRYAMAELLIEVDFEVVSALGEVVLVPEEGTTMADALLDFFESNGKTDKLLEWAVAKEIRKSSDTTTLFRDTCEATKLMPVLYQKLGTDYLKKLVGPLVKDVVSSGASFEIDPTRAEPGMNVNDNLKKILSIAKEFLRLIFDSIDECPQFLRRVLCHAQNEANKKFPAASDMVIGVFFFSRFLIPAVVSPSRYGLLLETPPPQAQRGLILISKLIQNLANGIEFDDTNDSYKTQMNTFINDNSQALHNFFDKLPVKEMHQPFFPVNAEKEQEALIVITSALHEHKDKIYSMLTNSEVKKTFLQIVQDDRFECGKGTFRRTVGRKKLSVKELEKVDQVDKLEELLEAEIKARKILEKQIALMAAQLADEQRINQENQETIRLLKENLELISK